MKEQSQPSLKALGIELSEYVFKLDKFDSIPALFEANSFDWGGASSAWQLSQHWKLDAQMQQLVKQLGMDSAMGQLVYKELMSPASMQEEPKESPALTSFWKKTSKMLQNSLVQTLANVEELLEEQRAEAFFQEAWEPQAAAAEEAAASASAAASGRIDGSEHSLQSGAGNLPLKQKLELA